MKKLLVMIAALATAQLGLTLAAGAQVVPAAPDPELAAVFAGGSLPQADLMPKPVLKCGGTCLTRVQHTSPTISGSGSSCTNASNSLSLQLNDIADTDCANRAFDGYCTFVIHDTTSCTLIGTGTYQIKGYATYACAFISC
jgi:hypothetical protein